MLFTFVTYRNVIVRILKRKLIESSDLENTLNADCQIFSLSVYYIIHICCCSGHKHNSFHRKSKSFLQVFQRGR